MFIYKKLKKKIIINNINSIIIKNLFKYIII